jgi:anhydro-N-acetylmuramic acid kinase
MVYKAIGIMSGSSLDGLDIACVNLQETGGKWNYEIVAAQCFSYTDDWKKQLAHATQLSALDYQLLHTAYGHYIGEQVNGFIEANGLQRQIHLIASHGHTSFHLPLQKMTAQLGDGAAIAAITCLPVVSDLRSLDIAHGGQGAPLVPIGEKLLFGEYDYFLNIGGIANITAKNAAGYIAFDVCPANKVLNMLAEEKHVAFDAEGKIAALGTIDHTLLDELNGLAYYQQSFPKSLANSFGTEVVHSIIKRSGAGIEDALRTYVEHISIQVSKALETIGAVKHAKLLITGGGAFNLLLLERLNVLLEKRSIIIVVPDDKLIEYKEALVMALIGVLRWREEPNVLSSVTGATQNSISGALWLGTEQ